MRYKDSSGTTVLPTPPPLANARRPIAPGIAWVHFMTTELDRRWRLIDISHHLCQVAEKQGDWEEAKRHISNQLRLLVKQCQTIELLEPGFITYAMNEKSFLETWEKLGITDLAVIEAIHRGQVDPLAGEAS